MKTPIQKATAVSAYMIWKTIHRCISKLATILAISTMVLAIFGQQPQSDVTPLRPGDEFERQLTGAQTQRFKVELKKNEVFQVRVEQKGVDVVLMLLDQTGVEVARMDSPNAKKGPETLTFIPARSGNYFLDIKGFDVNDEAGTYIIRRLPSRTSTAQDVRRVEVERLFVDAIKARNTEGQAKLAIEKLTKVAAGWRELNDEYLIALTEAEIKALDERLKEQERKEERARIAALLTEARELANDDTAASLKAAVAKCAEALERALRSGDKDAEAASHITMATVYFVQYENLKAIDEYNKAAALHRAIGDKQNEANGLWLIGDILANSGDEQKALDYFKRAQLLYHDVDDKPGEAKALSSIGGIYSSFGDQGTALEYLSRALAIAQAAKARLAEGRILNNMGTLFYHVGSRDLALEYFTRALSILKDFPQARSSQATALHNIGKIYAERAQIEEARDYFNQALAIFRAIPNIAGEARVLVGIASTYYRVRDVPQALLYLDRAYSLYKKAGLPSGEAEVLNNLGVIHSSDRGEHRKALDYYNQALLIVRATGAKTPEPEILYNIMRAWSGLGNRNVAVFYGKQAVNENQRQRQQIRTFDPEQQQSFLKSRESIYQRLADVLIADGRFAEAQQVLALLKDQEYFDYVRRDANEIKNLKDRVRLRPEEVKLLERYALLAGNVTQIGAEFQVLDQKKRALREGAALSAADQARYEELSSQLADANAAFRLFLEKQLVEELGKPVKKEIDVDRALQEKLRQWGDGTVALYTVVGEDRYRVILTTPTVQVDGKTEIKSADLNRKIFEFRAALKNPRIDPRPLGKELYDILIKPIEKDLLAANAKTLIWSLDGTLRYIPLAALSPDKTTYLVEKYRSVVITSATRQSLVAENETKWRALGVGVSTAYTVADPTAPGTMLNFSALPGVASELSSIVRDEQLPNESGLLVGKRLIDADFSAKNFAEFLNKEVSTGKPKYSIVHVASHFRLGDDSSNSFLLLGGGNTLTLQQISDSPQMRFGNVELVTLSACDTAFGNGTGKEVDSLATFIELRGAKAIIATLWAVADESTSLLMNEFYRLHKSDPQIAKGEAMRLAQLAMIRGRLKRSGKDTGCRAEEFAAAKKQPDFKCDSNAPYAHPFFWSPFVLIGNWR